MNLVIEDVTEAALSLPKDDRAILANRLIESLDRAPDTDTISDAWKKEIRRRLDEINSGAVELLDGSAGLKRVREAVRR